MDPSGSIFVVDSGNQRVRRISGGIITTLAGTGVADYLSDGGPASAAPLNAPFGLAVNETTGRASASVAFSGLKPSLVGVNQTNATVPAGAPSGNVDLVVTVNVIPSRPVRITVQ